MSYCYAILDVVEDRVNVEPGCGHKPSVRVVVEARLRVELGC
jgi:hypothetical protein